MKRVYVNEKWCLGCHLCEYNCAFAATGMNDMARALRNREIHPRIRVEDDGHVTYAVSCRHCEDPICVRSCIAGAITIGEDGTVRIDRNKCVGCFTCILVCPYGAVSCDGDGAVQKCELCLKTAEGSPACVRGCPNRAIVYEEREETE